MGAVRRGAPGGSQRDAWGLGVSDPVQTMRLYEVVVTRLQKEVIEGRLKHGDRLPSEHELAQHFGVSRTAIREAIKALVEQGVVAVRPGSGTYVARTDQRPLQRTLSWMTRVWGADGDRYLLELRQLLEPGVCALAARRATREQIDEMKSIFSSAESWKSDPEKFVEADLSFHRLMGEASQNPLVGALLDSVGDLLHAQRARYVSVPGAASRAQRHHRKILEVLELRDPDAAFQAMADHLRQVVRDVQRACEVCS